MRRREGRGEPAAMSTVTVGQWASYAINSPEMPGGMEMRYAIVAAQDGVDLVWFENPLPGLPPTGSATPRSSIPPCSKSSGLPC